jgi:hypothetical protein
VLSSKVSTITMATQTPLFVWFPAFANPDVLEYSGWSAQKLFKPGTKCCPSNFNAKARQSSALLGSSQG